MPDIPPPLSLCCHDNMVVIIKFKVFPDITCLIQCKHNTPFKILCTFRNDCKPDKYEQNI